MKPIVVLLVVLLFGATPEISIGQVNQAQADDLSKLLEASSCGVNFQSEKGVRNRSSWLSRCEKKQIWRPYYFTDKPNYQPHRGTYHNARRCDCWGSIRTEWGLHSKDSNRQRAAQGWT